MNRNLVLLFVLQGCVALVDWRVDGSQALSDTSTVRDTADVWAIITPPTVVGGAIATTIVRDQSLVAMDRFAFFIDNPSVVKVDDRTDLYKRSELVLRLIGEGDATVVVQGPRYDASPPLFVSARYPDEALTSLGWVEPVFQGGPIGAAGLHVLEGAEVPLETTFVDAELGPLQLRDGVVAMSPGPGVEVELSPPGPTDTTLYATLRARSAGPRMQLAWVGGDWRRSVGVQVHAASEITSFGLVVGQRTVDADVAVGDQRIVDVDLTWSGDGTRSWRGNYLRFDPGPTTTPVTACIVGTERCQTVDVPGKPLFTADYGDPWRCGCDHGPGGGVLTAGALAWALRRRRTR